MLAGIQWIRWRRWGASFVVALVASFPLLGGNGDFATSSLSTQQVAELKSIATSRPCAATALVYLWSLEEGSAHGTLEFDGVPSAGTVETLLDRSGESASKSSPLVLLRNPYSVAAFFVDVRWSVARISESSFVLTTSAELTDGVGDALIPAHHVEPATAILVSGKSLRLLAPPTSS